MKLCTCISLMTNDDELFMRSLTISLFYLKKHTIKSFAYVEIFFYCNSSYMLGPSPLYVICKYVLRVGCLFIFLTASFEAYSFSILFFFFKKKTACTFGVLCKKPLPNPKPQIFNLMLCSKGYADLCFPLRPMSQFEFVLYRVWDRVTIHAFVCCYPVVQALFNKETSSFSSNYLYNLAKSKLATSPVFISVRTVLSHGPKCPSLCQYLLDMEISSLGLTNEDPKGPTKNHVV